MDTGCPPGWQRLLVVCEGVPGRATGAQFLGPGWMHRFEDGFLAVEFAPSIETTQITHADGGKTFRFRCPVWKCGIRPEAREEKIGEWAEGLVQLGQADTQDRVVLDVGQLCDPLNSRFAARVPGRNQVMGKLYASSRR